MRVRSGRPLAGHVHGQGHGPATDVELRSLFSSSGQPGDKDALRQMDAGVVEGEPVLLRSGVCAGRLLADTRKNLVIGGAQGPEYAEMEENGIMYTRPVAHNGQRSMAELTDFVRESIRLR